MEGQLHSLHVEQLLILLHQGVLRFLQDLYECRLVEVMESSDYRQSADELRYQPKLQKIVRLSLGK